MKTPVIKDIDYLYDSFSKDKNDHINSIREDILIYVFNKDKTELTNYINDKTYGKKWNQLINEVHKALDNILTEKFDKLQKTKFPYDFEVIKKAGRTTIDFLVKIYEKDKNKLITEIKLEFKHNSGSVKDLPQFYQKFESHDIYKENTTMYSEYFYDTVISKLELNISKEYYLKHVKKTDTLANDSLIKKIIQYAKNNKTDFDNKVKKSIHDWLEKNKNSLNIKFFKEKFFEQLNKTYMMWDFNKDNILKSKLCVEDIDNSKLESLKYKELKKGNNDNYHTIVLEDDINEYHLLLRWKNTNGIRGTAWQISLKPKII